MPPFEMMSFREELMVSYALKHVGLPYIWGGDDPIVGFDCSGFAQEFLTAFGGHPKPELDLTAQGLHDELVKYAAKTEMTGSLAFYGPSFKKITHVAVCLGGGFIFEFGGAGSNSLTEEDAAKLNAYGRIRPIRRRSDFLTCLYPRFA